MKASHRDRMFKGPGGLCCPHCLWTSCDFTVTTHTVRTFLQLSSCANAKNIDYKTQHQCKRYSSQVKTAHEYSPPRAMSHLLDFTDPGVRLQSLSAGLPGNYTLPKRNEPPVCSYCTKQLSEPQRRDLVSFSGESFTWTNTDVLLSSPVAQVVIAL